MGVRMKWEEVGVCQDEVGGGGCVRMEQEEGG